MSTHDAPPPGIPDGSGDDEMRRMSCYTTPPARTLELLEEARSRCPVAQSDEFDGFHLLLDHADVKRAAADHETFSSEPQVLRPMVPRNPVPGLETDPPRHKEWRAIYNGAITAKTPEAMEPYVRADVDCHIDDFIERGSCDLIAELAEPVPAEAICRLMGIDEELVPEVRRLALAMFAAQGDPEQFERRLADFGAVTVAEVRRREAEPRDDYLTALTSKEVEGRRLDDDDYVMLMAAFLGAGHHSTTSAMSSLIFQVFSDPDIRDQLMRDPDRIPTAVEETLRLRPSFFGFFRRAKTPTAVAGVEIAAGDDVYLSWAAANRDPAMFQSPAEFRMDRGRNRHLTFGFGIHTCPGAPLARMELRVCVEQLLRRLPDLRLGVDELEYEFGGGDYAFAATLPATFTPGRPERAGA